MFSIKSFFQSIQKLDQHHPSDLLTHPRRLEAVIPVKEAQKVVDNAYPVSYTHLTLPTIYSV